MKALSIFKCYLLIMILSGNSFLFLISINKLPISPLDTIALTNSSYISSFDFDSSPYNELYLVFNERQMDNSKLFFIAADSDYQWNFTTETVLEENATLKLNNNPSIITSLEKIWIANSYTYGYDNGILLLSKNYLDKIWQKTIPYQMFNKSVFEPNLKLDESNQSIWLSWKDNHENTLNYYYMIYNITSGIWSNQFSLNIVNEYNCSTSDFIIDESGNAHFVWSQGGDFFKQIFYRYVMSNGTQGSVETITDGTTNCINPAIVFDSYNYLNVFWENQTIPFPQAYGTISIETSRKIIEGSWSQSFEVAPFIPVERPPSGESDAYQPAVTVDKSNNLWLA
ncbi:MAG: hypothetical protein FK731_13045, partial [Asgard group archaeon]|nr:hypothetical protein [Asgard group archaeon]